MDKTDCNLICDTSILEKIKKIEIQINKFKEKYNISQKSNSFDSYTDEKLFGTSFNSLEQEITELETQLNELEKKTQIPILNSNNTNVDAIDTFQNNHKLLISEKKQKVYLPYTYEELNKYLIYYPDEYHSIHDVINQEFVFPLSKYKNYTLSRFKETYELLRDIEMKSVLEALRKAFSVMLNRKIHPAIISACKSEEQLDKYLECIQNNSFSDFSDFEIVFEVNPLKNFSIDIDLSIPKNKKKKGKHAY